MGVHNLKDKSDFKSAIETDKVVVIDFFATWCGPCKMIAPKIVDMSEKPQYSNVSFVKIDVDEVPDVAQEYSIRAMPTFVILKNGEVVDEVVGANPAAIEAKIQAALDSVATGEPYKKPPSTSETNWLSYLPMVILAILVYRYMMGI